MPHIQTVDASLLNAKMQFCCNGLTLSEQRKISTSTSQLETKIIFNEKALHECFHFIVRGRCLNSAHNISTLKTHYLVIQSNRFDIEMR